MRNADVLLKEYKIWFLISTVWLHFSFAFAFSVYTPFHEEGDISKAQKAGEAIANAFIVIGVVLVLTIILVLLYKFRCYCVSILWYINNWGKIVEC